MVDKFDPKDAAKFVESTAKQAVDSGMQSANAADTLQSYLGSLSRDELRALDKQLKWDNHVPSVWSANPTVELQFNNDKVSACVKPSMFDFNADCAQLNLSIAQDKTDH